MNYILFLVKHILDIPGTIWLNFKVFEFKDAIKLPVMLSRNVKIKEIHKGVFQLPDNIRPFLIKIGIEGVDGVANNQKGCLVISQNSKLVFKGKTSISRGILLRSSGKIIFGSNFYCNCNLSIICANSIEFGDDCILVWNVHIRDCDGHSIYQNGEKINKSKKVTIGNHVWIGQDVKILKGVVIPKDSVVAMNSCVTKKFDFNNIIIGGSPAKIIKQNIDWEV